MSKFTKKCMASGRRPTQRPDAIHVFVNFDTKLEDFVNLGVLFLTMWINSC